MNLEYNENEIDITPEEIEKLERAWKQRQQAIDDEANRKFEIRRDI